MEAADSQERCPVTTSERTDGLGVDTLETIYNCTMYHVGADDEGAFDSNMTQFVTDPTCQRPIGVDLSSMRENDARRLS